MSNKERTGSTGMSFPVLALTVLGILIAMLGLFAAGNMVIVGVGLAAIFGAGVIGAIERLIDSRRHRAEESRG